MTWAYTIETGTMETQPLQETACWETTTTAENRVELCYNWNRYYDPVMGMYTQTDRITEYSGGKYLDENVAQPGLLAPYSYAAGNANYYYDLNGLASISGRGCWGIKCFSIRFACEDKDNGCGGTTAGKCELEIGFGIGFGGGFSFDPKGQPSGGPGTGINFGYRGYGSVFGGVHGVGAGLELKKGKSFDGYGNSKNEEPLDAGFGTETGSKTGAGFGGGFEGFIRF